MLTGGMFWKATQSMLFKLVVFAQRFESQRLVSATKCLSVEPVACPQSGPESA